MTDKLVVISQKNGTTYTAVFSDTYLMGVYTSQEMSKNNFLSMDIVNMPVYAAKKPIKYGYIFENRKSVLIVKIVENLAYMEEIFANGDVKKSITAPYLENNKRKKKHLVLNYAGRELKAKERVYFTPADELAKF